MGRPKGVPRSWPFLQRSRLSLLAGRKETMSVAGILGYLGSHAFSTACLGGGMQSLAEEPNGVYLGDTKITSDCPEVIFGFSALLLRLFGCVGCCVCGRSTSARVLSLSVTLLTVWVLFYVFSYGFGNLSVIF